MSRFLDWLLHGRCLRHSDPLFDRDERGRAVFRCPRCLATWEILPGLGHRSMKAPVAGRAEVVSITVKSPVVRSPLRMARGA
jgi:hypothetical protein